MRRDAQLLVIGLLGLVLAPGCNRKAAPAPAAAAPAPPTIHIIKPEMKTVKRLVEQPGAVMAFEESALQATLSGYIAAIAEDPDKKNRPEYDRFIDIGSWVKPNQLLARLARPELEEEFKQKIALVKQADAEVVQAEKALAAAGATVAAANAMVGEADAGVERAQALYENWQKELDRITKLVSGGVGDLQTRDQTQNQFRAAEAARKEAIAHVASAKAAVDKAVADRDKAAADVDAAKARRDVARAEVGRVDALRGYLEIKAPFEGIVTQRGTPPRGLNTGDLVGGNEKTVLFRVAKTDPVRVVVNVPEADAGLVAVGQEVRLALQGGPAAGEVGKVARTSWSLEPGSRTLRTEIDMPNDKGQVRPGMYAYAKLTAELPSAWAVPAAAVGKVNDEPVIYLVENGKAVRVSVELLRGDGQFTQIRRYKRAAASEWTDISGSEPIATPAAAVSDGQAVP
jgi:HlyD family secretion protein